MDGLSEYEMERRRKMERNHRTLQELGLVGRGEPWKDPSKARKAVEPQRRVPKAATAAATSTAPPAAGVAVRKSLRTRRKPVPVYTPPAAAATTTTAAAAASGSGGVAVRQSLRTKDRISPAYRDDYTDSSGDEESDLALSPHQHGANSSSSSGGGERGVGSKRSRHLPAAKREDREPRTRSAVASPTPPGALRRASTPAAPDSSRNLECDIPMLMERYLGRQFPSFGKAPVMELSTKSCPPKFSRMSGVTEWNNAVFLWVNVDGSDGYENLFERDSSQEDGGVDESKVPGNHAATAAAASRETGQGVAGAEATAADEPSHDGWLGRWKQWKCRASAPAPAPPDGPLAGKDGHQSGTSQGEAAETAAVAGGRLPGLRMTWYAGSRMTAESALIQRLLVRENPPKVEDAAEDAEAEEGGSPSPGAERRAVGDDGGGDGGGDGDVVLLFCRLPNEPYVFCGRVGYSKHWAAERPIRFVWRLLDAERLARWPDFGAIVEVAGVE